VDPERWRKIEDLYHAARAVEPDQRTAFLQEKCAGDESLGREVKLLHGENAASFLEGSGANGTGISDDSQMHDSYQSRSCSKVAILTERSWCCAGAGIGASS